jgi:hypothetical protein
MKKKIVMFCLFVIMMLMMIPSISALPIPKEQSTVRHTKDSEKQDSFIQENPEQPLGTGYLLIHVFAFTPGMGIYSYKGAVVNVRGFLYSYNGTTDNNGDILFTVHTRLFRPKMYLVKVSVISNDRLVSKINSIFIERQQIAYKEFLFVVL